MDRRRFLLTSLAGALAVPSAPAAQQVGAVYRVGLLWSGGTPPSRARMASFREGLRESGYVEGQNLTIDVRYGEDAERLHALAAELIALHVNALAAFGDLGPNMARRAHRRPDRRVGGRLPWSWTCAEPGRDRAGTSPA